MNARQMMVVVDKYAETLWGLLNVHAIKALYLQAMVLIVQVR